MAKILLRKTWNNHLVPDMEQDEERVGKIKVGEIVQAEITRPRNIQFHRKFFVLLNIVFDNQDIYDTRKALRTEIILKAGYYVEHVTTKGELIYIPDSLSFAKMDEIIFNEFYQKAIDVVLKYFISGLTKEAIDQQVLQVLDFS